jgi:hypothetical protein
LGALPTTKSKFWAVPLVLAHAALTLFGQARLTLPDQIAASSLKDVAVQVSATNAAAYTPRPAVSGEASAQIVDLTQLAVAQTNVKMTAAAGAALGQTTGELTGVLVNISA